MKPVKTFLIGIVLIIFFTPCRSEDFQNRIKATVNSTWEASSFRCELNLVNSTEQTLFLPLGNFIHATNPRLFRDNGDEFERTDLAKVLGKDHRSMRLIDLNIGQKYPLTILLTDYFKGVDSAIGSNVILKGTWVLMDAESNDVLIPFSYTIKIIEKE